jgi:LuxR family transcriptional regulator, maltose regulon positive regulatory protein
MSAAQATTAPQRTSPQRYLSPLPYDVIESRIQPPVLRPGLVSRTALVNRLRATDSLPVVAMTAPAGYGKTTVLTQWAARDARPFAWISVDKRDRDPIVLLQHVAAALRSVEPLEPDVLEALAAPGASVWTAALPRLGAALSAFEPVVIVLDDLHLLESAETLEAITVLADHLPAESVLVLAGRVTPNLPIAALRAAGRLLEVGVDQLALSPREGQLLLRSTGVELSLKEVTRLVHECEGWPAALYFAGLGLGNEGASNRYAEKPKPIRAAGREKSLADYSDYFRAEYFSRLRPEDVRFLRRTSVLEQMTGDLCDSVLGEEGSAQRLRRIERSNLFLIPLDRERVSYRYHRLFRDVLRKELEMGEPVLVPELHSRAADWYETHGDPESALDHADAAKDLRRVARILATIALPLYHSGRVVTVERWLARFDDPVLLMRYPMVAVQGSWIHALRGRSAEAKRWLEIAETDLAGKGSRGSAARRSWVTAIRAALCNEGVYQMIADAETALEGVARDSPIRPGALMALGAAYMLLGQNERADAILAEAAAEAHRLGAIDTHVVAVGERSIIAAAKNDTPAAERLALEAQELVEKSSLDGYGTTAIALAASARTSLRRGQWDEARADLDKVRALSPSLSSESFPWFAVQVRIELARSYLALRETRSVRSVLNEIHELLREHPYVGVLVDETQALEREIDAIPPGGGTSAGLTPAELRLLPYLTTHLSFREIGDLLYVSRNTIKTQAISVYRKLGVTSRSQAIECATQLGLVEGRPEAA